MPRKPGRILPFRIPFFRIFYSTTYTTLYIIEVCLLAVTPIQMIYSSITARAYQYVIMVGGVYLLTALLATFIYSSRLYTNRSVLAAVGKAYIPIEDGEVGKSVRKMIVKQLQRSDIVAWESKPRDLEGEILQAARMGILRQEDGAVGRDDYLVGRIIPVDPEHPPWGRVQHAGWSSPSHREDNKNPDVQFADVIAELPNLIEARAIGLAPIDPTMTPTGGEPVADPTVVELLRRPETMGLRDYLTQLSYLGLVNPPELGQTFLRQYERARFSGRPITEDEFTDLMANFSELLSNMTELDPAIIEQIRAQLGDNTSLSETSSMTPSQPESVFHTIGVPSPVPPPSMDESSQRSPVTAREGFSRNATPSTQVLQTPSIESFSSVVVRRTPTPQPLGLGFENDAASSLQSASLASLPPEVGSVLVRHPVG
jgi:hypothetical protein